jgi:putative transposase
MKRKRYSDEQIAFALRQAENGTLVEEVCRKLGVSEATSTGGRSSSPAWAWWRSVG